MPSLIPTSEQRQAAQTPRTFAEIVRQPRHLALDYSFNNDDRNDPQVKGLYKLYGSSQDKDGQTPVRQLAYRNMVMADLPGFVALVRECAVPLNKLPVTSDFGGAFVFAVDPKSKSPDVQELYAVSADKVAISFAAVGAILTNRNKNVVPSTRFPGRFDPIPAQDAQGNRLTRLGIAADASPVASSAPAGQGMRALLSGAVPAGAPAIDEANIGSAF